MKKQSKIPARERKDFRVGDYFDVSYGKHVPKTESVDKEEGVPHITTTQYDNGVGYYVKEKMFDGNAITVASDGCQGASFYQEGPFSASNIVSVLQPKDKTPLNADNASYICTLLREEGKKYSWDGFKFSVERVRETLLNLPARKPPEMIKLVNEWKNSLSLSLQSTGGC